MVGHFFAFHVCLFGGEESWRIGSFEAVFHPYEYCLSLEMNLEFCHELVGLFLTAKRRSRQLRIQQLLLIFQTKHHSQEWTFCAKKHPEKWLIILVLFCKEIPCKFPQMDSQKMTQIGFAKTQLAVKFVSCSAQRVARTFLGGKHFPAPCDERWSTHGRGANKIANTVFRLTLTVVWGILEPKKRPRMSHAAVRISVPWICFTKKRINPWICSFDSMRNGQKNPNIFSAKWWWKKGDLLYGRN